MPCRHRLRTVACALLAFCGAAFAANPVPGEYATQPGGGTLLIAGDNRGAHRFELYSTGTNGHTCQLEGRLDGAVATTASDNDPECRMAFNASGNRIEVKGTSKDLSDCRNYCGLRAGFEGEYVRVPPGCNVAGRERRNQAFLADYRGKRHAAALATLEKTRRECGAFFDWIEKDAFANDKALTLHHLKRDKECLAVLRDTLVADNKDEAELEKDFWPAPTDWDSYLPVAKANWHNRRLCEASLRSRPKR